MTEKVESVVKKGTKEFAEARQRFLSLFHTTQHEETIVSGIIGQKTTQIEKLKEIPMPFGCPDLELYVWSPQETKDGKWAVAYFCGRVGCLCSPCREDFDETYPSYCPEDNEFTSFDEEWGDESDYDY